MDLHYSDIDRENIQTNIHVHTNMHARTRTHTRTHTHTHTGRDLRYISICVYVVFSKPFQAIIMYAFLICRYLATC